MVCSGPWNTAPSGMQSHTIGPQDDGRLGRDDIPAAATADELMCELIRRLARHTSTCARCPAASAVLHRDGYSRKHLPGK
jgi:hypothetical protein